jgi:hypothetical protein
MDPLTHHVRALLAEKGHLFLGEDGPPRAVEVRPNSSARVASLAFPGGPRRLVVKPVAAEPAGLRRPEKLCSVHEAVRARSAALAGRTPRLLGIDPGHRLVVMEYVAGPTLLALLRRSLGPFRRGAAPCEPLLRQAASLLAQLHRLAAAEVGVPGAPSANGAYRADFEASWRDPLVRGLLPAGYADPQRLYDRLPPSFFGRAEDRLLLVDTQPKNMLVADGGAVYLIDLDYSAGNPAVGLAQFLVGLDRLGLRHVLTRPAARIAAWKRCVVAAYFEQAPAWVAEDLVYFYPQVLLQMIGQHAAARPWLRWYLAGYYGRRLRGFLTNLDRLPAGGAGRSPAELFSAPPAA